MPRISELEYPYNLVDDVLNASFNTLEPINPLPDDFIGSVAYVVCTLNEQEQHVVSFRYEQRMTYKAIGEEMNLSVERVRQIVSKALRKMRHPNRMRYLRYGVSGVQKAVADKAAKDAMRLYEEQLKAQEKHGENPSLFLKIESIGLSTRSYNVLHRNGVETVSDVIDLGYDKIKKFRNSGKMVMKDITECLSKLGIEFR